jgi:hypothetical protein
LGGIGIFWTKVSFLSQKPGFLKKPGFSTGSLEMAQTPWTFFCELKIKKQKKWFVLKNTFGMNNVKGYYGNVNYCYSFCEST